MRQRRRLDQWFAGALGLALLFVISGSAGAQSASPDPSTSVDPSPSASATDAPSASPTESPTASAGFVCEAPSVRLDPPDVHDYVRGESVRVLFAGFLPNSAVTLVFEAWWGEIIGRPIGTADADADGKGAVEGVIPLDAPIEEARLQVVGSDGCMAMTDILVLGSEEAISIDDDTVIPGQRVTVSAGGLTPNTSASLSIDIPPVQGECLPCNYLAHAQTSGVGSVVFRVRIPRGTSAGAHKLWVTGSSPDGISDAALAVDITVLRDSTLPSTDTASAG